MEQKGKSQLVQQKIKHMLQTRKRVISKGTPSQIMRLKSNQDSQNIDQQPLNQTTKPRSSISKRPQSSYRSQTKAAELHSATTDSTSKTDIDVVGLINDVFDKSFELTKYFNRKQMDPDIWREKLLRNGLFHTLLISRLGKVNEEMYESVVEKEIQRKLEKMCIRETQERNCKMIEDKISLLLEQRLKSLTTY